MFASLVALKYIQIFLDQCCILESYIKGIAHPTMKMKSRHLFTFMPFQNSYDFISACVEHKWRILNPYSPIIFPSIGLLTADTRSLIQWIELGNRISPTCERLTGFVNQTKSLKRSVQKEWIVHFYVSLEWAWMAIGLVNLILWLNVMTTFMIHLYSFWS